MKNNTKFLRKELGHMTIEVHESGNVIGYNTYSLKPQTVTRHYENDIQELREQLQLNKIMQLINENGGATVDSNLIPLESDNGYMVSIQGHEKITQSSDLKMSLVKEYVSLAKRLNGYIGFWKDGSKLFLDISKNILDKSQAVKVGKENKQLAIFDIKNGKTIRL